MSEHEESLRRDIRRILIALDASTHSLAALETAINLATTLEAQLEGLFVEDVNVLRLAELPFVRQVRTLSAVTQPVSRLQLEAELQAQAARARRALMGAARRARVPATFRVVRGQVPLEVLAAAMEADLLVLGRISRPLTRRRRLGSTARTVFARAPRSVFLVQSTPVHSIMVTYDGSLLAQRALTIAANLSRAQAVGAGLVPAPGRVQDPPLLTVLLLAEEPALVEQLREQAALWLETWSVTADYHWPGRPTVANLAKTAQEAGCSLLVLGGERLSLSEAAVQSLLDTVGCSLMLIR